MAEELNTNTIIQKYTGIESVMGTESQEHKNKTNNGPLTEINVDNYYNFYGVMSPEVSVRFLKSSTRRKNSKPLCEWIDINSGTIYSEGKKTSSGITQNNYFVSASIEDTGVRKLNLTLFDRSFYSLQELIYQAIKAGGGRNLTDSDNETDKEEKTSNLKIESASGEELTSLDFVYQPNNTMLNNLQIIWGYSDENPSKAATKAITTQDYFKNINSDGDKDGNGGSNSRWNERKDIESNVYSSNGKQITQGNYADVLSSFNQSTIRSSYEEFFITNVTTTLTNTGVQYNISAISTDNFILNGYKFIQMYANLQGTPRELLALFMKAFNDSENSLLKVIWDDKDTEPINGNEYIKNYNGEYVENNEENKNNTISKYNEELNKLLEAKKIYKNSMAVLRRDDSQDIDNYYFNRQNVYYGTISSSLNDSSLKNIKLGDDDMFSSIIAFIDANNHRDDDRRNFKDISTSYSVTNQKDLIKLIKLVNRYWGTLKSNNQSNYGSDSNKYAYVKQCQALLLLIIKSKYYKVSFDDEEIAKKFENIDTSKIKKFQEDLNNCNDKLTNIQNYCYGFDIERDYADWERIINSFDYKTVNSQVKELFYNQIIPDEDRFIIDESTGENISNPNFPNLESLDIEIKNAAKNYIIRNSIETSQENDFAIKLINCLWKKTSGNAEDLRSLYDSLDNKLKFIKDIKEYTLKDDNDFNFESFETAKIFVSDLIDFLSEPDQQDKVCYTKFHEYTRKNCWKCNEYNGHFIFEFFENEKYDGSQKSLIDLIYNNENYIKVNYKNASDDPDDPSAGKHSNNKLKRVNLLGKDFDMFIPHLPFDSNIYTTTQTNINALTRICERLEKIATNLISDKNNEVNKEYDKYILNKIQNIIINETEGKVNAVADKWGKLTATGNSGKTYKPEEFWDKVFNLVNNRSGVVTENYTSELNSLINSYESTIRSIDSDISYLEEERRKSDENDNGLITICLGGEESRNNYSEDGKAHTNSLYYKSISSLFTSYTSQCPPYIEIKPGSNDETKTKDATKDKVYKAINDNGEQVTATIETQENNRRMQWSVVGNDKEGRPIVGFRYAKPFKVGKLRVYNWGNGNSEQHCIKNLSIQNSSEFGMLNMALSVDTEGNMTKIDSNGLVANVSDFYVGKAGSAFVNAVTTSNNEKNSIINKMVNGVRKGTIEVLGDPSLRFQNDYAPYCYPIKLNIKLQRDNTWADNNSGYIPCQLSGYYVITKITHNISSSGYTTTMEVMSYPGIDKFLKK